jgi:hypothetical protein
MAFSSVRLLVPAASGLVGGIVGGALVWALVAHGAPRATGAGVSAEIRAGAAPDPAPDEVDDVDDRITRLERRNAAAQALGEAVRAMKAGDAQPFAPSDVKADNPVFELAVRSVLEKVEWEKTEERKVDQQNRRAERAAHMAEYLTQKLSLTGAQKANVETIFAESMDAFRNLREPADGGRPAESRQEWRKSAEAIRTQTEQRLAQVLTPSQLQSYQALQDDDDEVRSWRRPGRR